ncbi:hypothetical protein IWQ60_004158 [Tieghemiomyces parasiticus]|uniref:Serine aminopeptidase S33 domain-containing protein n=1 Tax=Tieghemiomyces parasiticus TaxID=78921 RepID=A0A9W8DU56_9FUNG|nr:hypothetical protein IWQ60_004158 [Tieghemiomyces parasiticus]
MSTTTLRQDCRAQPVPEATDLVLHTEPVGEETEAWEDVNGTAMFTCHYKAVQEPPRATLVLVHGFGEHCMRYVAVCRTFASQGIEVLTYDQRGFGRTGRKNNQMGVTRGIQQLQRDMTFMNRRVRRAATASQPAIPHFVLGHSMGGMEVLSYILQCPEETAELITGAIVTSSAIQLAPDAQPNPVMRIISKVASTLFKSVTIRRPLNLERLSRDPAVGQAVRHDEYYYLIGSLQCRKYPQ